VMSLYVRFSGYCFLMSAGPHRHSGTPLFCYKLSCAVEGNSDDTEPTLRIKDCVSFLGALYIC